MRFSELVDKLADPAITHSVGADPEITGIAGIEEAIPQTLSYIESSKYAAQLQSTTASALVLPKDATLLEAATNRGLAWLAAPNPRLLFAKAISLFYQPFHPAPEIHPTAVIHPTAQIGQDVYIGPYVVIQAEAQIGDGVCIHPGVVVYPQVVIGDRTVLHANCVIQERVQLGADCVIHSGAVIGSEGFGFVPSPTGLFKMHQSGYTVLENGVEVGCNSAIDRPATGKTRIGPNTKIDNLVQIAHGCETGHNCAIAAQVGMAGAVKLGNGVMLAGQVGIANQITMADGAIATAQSGLVDNVASGAIVSGYPAIPNRNWLKSSAVYKQLPEMQKSLRQLQHQVSELQSQLAALQANA